MTDLVPTSSRPRPGGRFDPPPSDLVPDRPLKGASGAGRGRTSSLTSSPAGLTAAEFALRLPASPLSAEEILRDLKAQGLAERDADGRWRLTPEADRTIGAGLRAAGGGS